jgi:hypothetical protein
MPSTAYPLSALSDIPEAVEEPVAPLAPPAALPTIERPPRPDASQVQARYQSELDEVKRRQTALDKSEQERLDREKGQLESAFAEEKAADDKLLADFAAGQQAYREATRKLPEWQPKPIVKAEDYQNFSMMLMGLGLIFGTAFHGGWMETAGLMNGAMQGYLDGDLEKANKDWDDFQRHYQGQMDKVKAAQKEMEDVLYADNLTLNAKHRELEKLAAIQGNEAARAAAAQKSIDHLMSFADAQARAILSADTKYEAMVGNMNTAMARLRASYGATDLLTDHAKQAYDALLQITGGKSDIVKALNSRFMRSASSPRFNEMIEGMMQAHPEWKSGAEAGRQLAQNSVQYQGEIAAFRQTLQREAGVARLTLAVQGLEEEAVKAAQQFGLYDQRWMNMPVNALRDKLGDADYTRFHNLIVAVARQYIEAITMPGSNAQLHASSQEIADHMISDDMTLSQIVGAFEAFNLEIASTGSALQTTHERLLDSIGASGVKSLITFNGSMFSGPMTQDQLDAKWNHLPAALTH